MSLLLDALKRAEHAKRTPPLSLEPTGTDSVPPVTPARPAVAGVAPGPSLGSAARRAEQEAARSVFTAKQVPVQNRPMWLLLGGLALLAIAAGGFWLWYTVTYQTSQPSVIAQAPLAPRPAMLPLPIPPPAVETPTPIPPPASEAAKPTPVPEPRTPPVRPAAPASSSPPKPAPQSPQSPQLKRSGGETETVSPELSTAYDGLLRGDYPVARQQYQLIAHNDPFNVDAQLGLATIAAANGDVSTAQTHYQRALEIDPKNPVAGAGLAALQNNQNAAASEQQLRAQIGTQPPTAAPYSALGHVYSSQSRWGEAQQAFFEAYRLDPGNPDHAFNLAVSLDHLGQTAPAREYYGKALELSAARPAAFTAAQVTARLNQLTP